MRVYKRRCHTKVILRIMPSHQALLDLHEATVEIEWLRKLLRSSI
jgi:hypothetical protein